MLGEEHPSTLTSASYLASSIFGQGNHAEAERQNREVLDAMRRVLGEEHLSTLTSASAVAIASREARGGRAINRQVLAAADCERSLRLQSASRAARRVSDKARKKLAAAF